MNCKRAKSQIALLIGNDLDPAAAQSVRKHVNECAGCRQHWQQLSSCMEALQQPAVAPWHSVVEKGAPDSLWPEVSAKLATRANTAKTVKPHRLSGWAPTVAVAAAVAMMFWITGKQQTGNDALTPGRTIYAEPVIERPAIPPEYLAPRTGRMNQQSDMFRLEGQGPSRLLLDPVPGQFDADENR